MNIKQEYTHSGKYLFLLPIWRWLDYIPTLLSFFIGYGCSLTTGFDYFQSYISPTKHELNTKKLTTATTFRYHQYSWQIIPGFISFSGQVNLNLIHNFSMQLLWGYFRQWDEELKIIFHFTSFLQSILLLQLSLFHVIFIKKLENTYVT